MSGNQESAEMAANRRKRINRLKKIILATIAALIVVPTVGCIVLAIRVGVLQDELEKKSITTVVYESNDSRDYDSAGLGNQSSQEIIETQNHTEQKEPQQPEDVSGEEQEQNSDEVVGEGQVQSTEVSDNPETDEKQVTEGEKEESETSETIRKVYLTFDDGPSENTDKILDVLNEYDVKGTFFVIGKTNEIYIPMYQRIVEEGHSLGMHSFSHEYESIYENVDSFREDLHKIQDYLYDVTGELVKLYRFPGGSSNGYCRTNIKDYLKILKDYNVSYFDWNVSSEDASAYILTKEEIAANVLGKIEKHDTVVVLFHDAAYRDTTVEALPEIIEGILAMENTVILPITEDTELVQHRWLE